MNSSSNPEITQLLTASAEGSEVAGLQLFEIVYSELRQLAERQMRAESDGHTLQPTALVHEVWLKLVGKTGQPQWKSRSHFFSTAARAMRRILVDSARARRRQKRGGDGQKFEIREDDLIAVQDNELLALDEALDLLSHEDETKAQLVQLRYFGGLTISQAAEQLGISTATADRYWVFAKAWLRAKMSV